MPEKLLNSLLAAIDRVEREYYQLVLVVGRPGAGKTKLLQRTSEQKKIKMLNVNLQLSELLMELNAKQRKLQLPRLFGQLLADETTPIILDNLEILFDTTLHQNPLKLLQQHSRNRTIIASWSGGITHNKLCYAAPGHPEYRTYETQDVQIITLPLNKASNAFQINDII